MSTNRDRIICYKCREYDHFMEDCPTAKEERDIEQIEQMFNLDKEQTSLKTLATVTCHNHNKINSLENIRLTQEQIEQDQELSKLDATIGDINYGELIVNNAEKIETVLSQMEQWSILSKVVNYIQYDRHPKNFHNLNIKAVSKEKYKIESNVESEERQMLELGFNNMPEKLKEECVWMFVILLINMLDSYFL